MKLCATKESLFCFCDIQNFQSDTKMIGLMTGSNFNSTRGNKLMYQINKNILSSMEFKCLQV